MPVTAPVWSGPLDARDRDAVRAFRQLLDAHDFGGAACPPALGPALRSNFPLRIDLPLYLRRLAEPTPINTLVKLFVLDQQVAAEEAARAFAPLDVAAVAAMGLVEETGGGVAA